MKISVTANHIKNSYRRSSRFCPIARAIASHFPLHTVSAGMEYITLYDQNLWKSGIYKPLRKCSTPDIVKQFISNFDNKLPVEPFEFDLTL